MNRYTVVNRVFAAIAFLIALVTYATTLQPSVPFWDCGEFSAAIAWQQVPHPPGAPLWLIVGKMFHLLPIGDPGWRVNLAAGICSAFASLFAYLTVVKIIERWRPLREGRNWLSYLPTFGGALIASLAFTWSDSQWFNSVESEVYAGGSLLIAIMIYLMMRWDEQADRPGHERYLLMIAYVTGLAIGVHLLALLVIPAIAIVIYFKRYEFDWKKFAILMVITGAAFYFLIYKATITYIPGILASNVFVGVLLLGALVGLVWWAVKNKQPIAYISGMSMILIVLGYTTYSHVLIRSNSHPPMNENEPDTFSELKDYLGRTQYGNRGAWPRRQEVEQYYRQYQDQYGEWFEPVGRNQDDGTYIYDKVNASGELNFMFKYQIGQMYLRYFAWNFIGRASDVQDAPAVVFSASKEVKQKFIEPTGYENVFPITFFALPFLLGCFGLYYHYKKDWKMAFVYTTLFLFLGLIPTLQQNQQQPQPRERDYFYTGSFMVWAMWIGIGAAGLAEKLRERRLKTEDGDEPVDTDDPSGQRNLAMVGGALAFCLLIAPLNMAIGGWKLHNRAGNWVPWDYAYNILQSCEKDAILFTNGDNDTFPLWYIQDVAGVRRDVRVVNLSLGNTLWYIWQLKNERPWGAKQVPISFSDESLKVAEDDPNALQYDIVEQPPTVSVDVPAAAMARATKSPTAPPGKMTWVLSGQDMGGGQAGGGRQLIRVQDKLIRNIIENNKWERPIYFSSTVGGDAWAGLEQYFRSEGMAFRVMPVSQGGVNSMEAIDADIMAQCLQNQLPDDKYYTEPHYGFKFRNLNNTGVFFMEDHRRIPNMQYRPMFMTLAMNYMLKDNDTASAIKTLDALERTISPELFPIPYPHLAQLAQLYRQAGRPDKANKYAQQAIDAVDKMGNDWENNMYARSYNPLQVKAQMLETMGQYDQAIQLYQGLQQQYPNDPNLRAQIENLQVEKYLSKNDTTGAITELDRILAGYGNVTDPTMMNNSQQFRQRLMQLRGQTIAPPATTSAPGPDSAAGAK